RGERVAGEHGADRLRGGGLPELVVAFAPEQAEVGEASPGEDGAQVGGGMGCAVPGGGLEQGLGRERRGGGVPFEGDEVRGRVLGGNAEEMELRSGLRRAQIVLRSRRRGRGGCRGRPVLGSRSRRPWRPLSAWERIPVSRREAGWCWRGRRGLPVPARRARRPGQAGRRRALACWR